MTLSKENEPMNGNKKQLKTTLCIFTFWVSFYICISNILHLRDGNRSGRDSSTGRSSRLKNRSNSSFWQLKYIEAPTEIYLYILSQIKLFIKKQYINKPLLSKTLDEWFQAVTDIL